MIRAPLAALAALLCLAETAAAASLVAARVIPGRTVIAAEDVGVARSEIAGALTDPAEAVGREARVTIYAGRPIRAADLAPPALVERNDVVRMVFVRGGLRIQTMGRALGRGPKGARLRVMNLASRAVVEARVAAAGLVEVTP